MLIKIQPIVYSVKLCIVLVYLAVLENYLSIALQLKMLVGPQHIDIRLREILHLFNQADDRCSENRDNQAWIVTDFLYL